MVTFAFTPGATGDLPLMRADVEGLRGNKIIDVTEVTKGVAQITGSFRLSFRGYTTEPIQHGAGAVAVEQALQLLPSIDDVDV